LASTSIRTTMLEIRLLGPSDVVRCGVRDPAADAVQRQPKRLALLAYLCLATRGGAVRRDTVLALFWPELDQSRARAALRQALHYLRQHLGEAVIEARGDDLLVPPAHCPVDAVAFDAALAAERWTDAATLYRGPLLDGLHVAGAGEAFERWLLHERARLHDGARLAVDEIGRAAEAAGEARCAVRWARRAVELEPLREVPVRRLMRLLDRAGEHDQVAGVYAALERRLLAERGTAPSADTAALAAALRPAAAAAPTRAAPAPPGPPIPTIPDGVGAPAPARDRAPGDPQTDVPSPAPHARGGRPALAGRLAAVAVRSRALRPAGALAGLALVAAAVFGLRAHISAAESGVALDGRMVAVAPFRTGGADPALGYLREGMLDLLAARLAGDGGPRAAEPRTVLDAWARAGPDSGDGVSADGALAVARSLGAGRLLLGGVVGTPRRLELTASLLDAADGRVRGTASASGPEDSLAVLVDQLTVQLLVRDADEAAEHQLPLAHVALPAIRAYLAGHAAYRRGELAGAASHFERALAIDSTFALAALGLVTATWWPGLNERGPYAQVTAWSLRHRLSARDRALLAAYVGPAYPARASWTGSRTFGEQLAAWEHARDLAPDRAQPWYEIGDVLFHWGPALAVRNPRVIAAGAFARAVALDPNHSLARDHLLQLALFEGDTAAVRRHAAHYFARNPAGDNADLLRWHVALALGDGGQLAAIRAHFDRMSADALGSIVGLGQQLAWRYPDAIDDAERAAAVLRVRSTPQGSIMVRLLDLNRGRPAAALRGNADASAFTHMDAAVHALYWDADPANAAPLLNALAHAAAEPAPPTNPAAREARLRDRCVGAQWRLARGEAGTVQHAVRALRAASVAGEPDVVDPATPRCAALLDAMLAVHERRPDARAAVDRLDALLLREGEFFGSTPVDVYASNLVLARLRVALGDVSGALAATRRRSYQAFYGSIFLSTYLREEARLAARVGDRAGAIRAYRHYLLLRANPEPALRPDAGRVRAELARLEGEPAPR
jgi:serine/threonine-protein kinase